MQHPRSNRWYSWIGASVLTYLVCVVFFPIVGFEFVDLDVPTQVVENPHIRGLTLENVRHIFTTWCITSYYPIRTLTYAIDYQVWGLDPGGFKLTNGIIHWSNVLLTFWLILRLFRHSAAAGEEVRPWWETAVATFCAGVFAIHPVVVEPVAWVAGREELLMTLGGLGCLHFHIAARRLGAAGGKGAPMLACHAGAAICCAAACLSNAVGAIIPALVVAWDLVVSPRTRIRAIVLGTAPLWAIAAAAVAIKACSPEHDVFPGQPGVFSRVIEKLASASSPGGGKTATLSAERLMLVLNVYWLNWKALIWPANLSIARSAIRPESFLTGGVLLGGIAVFLTAVVLWIARRRTLVVLGLVWFGLALGPTCQIMHHHTSRADRYLYLPLVGLAVAASAALRPAGTTLSRRAAVGWLAAGALVLFLLDTLSARQVQTWRNSLSMWENCVRADPGNLPAQMYFAENLATGGELQKAAEEYRRLVRLNPDALRAILQLVSEMACSNQQDIRDYQMAIRLATIACDLTDGQNPECQRSLALAYTARAESQVEEGKPLEAVENFRNALAADPDYPPALLRLAIVLATSEDKKLNSPQEAVRLAELGCRLSKPDDPQGPSALAAVYAAVGRHELAVGTVEKAIAIAENAGDEKLAGQLRERLRDYLQSAARE